MNDSPDWLHANNPLSSQTQMALRADLRRFAAQHLPEAMVPARFVVLKNLPKLPNGKVDRKQLPVHVQEDALDELSSAGQVLPSTEVELKLAHIWRDLLGVSRIGVHDSFFSLGGNSLSAVQMAARIRETFDVSLSLKRVFEQPTIAGLAGLLGSAPQAGRLPVASDRSITPQALLAESELPWDVRPDADARPAAATPYRRVLLTGGTGYTGAFILRELLERSDASVHVIVRAADRAQAWQRVKDNLAEYGIWQDRYGQRITGVPGDIGRPYLGLAHADYHHLAEHIEMIVHNAALSNYAQPYAALKPVNVLGTIEALRLAGRRQIKPLHFVSSLAVHPVQKGSHVFEEAALTDPAGVIGGYQQSKWVADRLVTQAHARGIPTIVYRPGQLCGAQSNGACSTDTFLNAAIKGCIQLGAALDFDVTVEMVPVDHCAAAVAHIALTGRLHGSQFHLKGARSQAWREISDLIEQCGYPLAPTPYAQWFRRLRTEVEAGGNNELAKYLALFGDEAPNPDVGEVGATPLFANDRLLEALRGSGIECSVMDLDFMRRCLDYFVQIGYLPPQQRLAA